MFYEEKLIDGRLYCRGTPAGDWRLVTIEELTRRVLDAEAKLAAVPEEQKPVAWLKQSGNMKRVDLYPELDAWMGATDPWTVTPLFMNNAGDSK